MAIIGFIAVYEGLYMLALYDCTQHCIQPTRRKD